MAKYRRWKPTQTLWLPGDKLSVLEFEYRRAVKRDGRLNTEELRVLILIRACRTARGNYPWWRCADHDPCVFCQEIADI